MVKESRLLVNKVLAVGESRKQFNDLVTGLREEFKPQGFYEHLLVDKVAVDYWRLKKLLLYEKEHVFQGNELSNLIYDNSATQVISYQKSIEKSIENGIKALKIAQNQRKLARFSPF